MGMASTCLNEEPLNGTAVNRMQKTLALFATTIVPFLVHGPI